MVIREASENDNEELLALTKACPMDGLIKLLIDRQPDFFALLRLKGAYKVYVAEAENKIIGSFALTVKESYINESQEKVGYLSDLKIHPQFRKTRTAWRLITTMHAYMQTLPINFYLCLIARGNVAVEKLLSGRLSIPTALKAAEFNVYQILPTKKEMTSSFIVEETDASHREQITELLNEYHRQFQFATYFDMDHDISGDQAWMIRKDGRIVAFLSVKDTMPFKQNIVSHIPFHIKTILRLLRLFMPSLATPIERSPLKILNIKYLAYSSELPNSVIPLIQRARNYAYRNGFTFLSYGIDKKNPLEKVFRNFPKVIFQSSGYLFDFSTGKRCEQRIYHDNFYQV
jgi:N-acetylglutamate synthase-like GNAT family acetyltransferase